MKPFTEYHNDKLVEASKLVLSKDTDNAKAIRAANREAQLLKTREKSLADKRKRASFTGGKTLKFVEEVPTEPFYRLPGNVINNELYVAVKTLVSIERSLKNGNDLDMTSLKGVITTLNAIAKQAQSFKPGDDVPLSYQYKTKQNNNTVLENARKGDVRNLTLKKGEYKLNEETISLSTPFLKDILRAMETQRFSDWYEEDFLDYIQGETGAKSEQEIMKDLVDLINR